MAIETKNWLNEPLKKLGLLTSVLAPLILGTTACSREEVEHVLADNTHGCPVDNVNRINTLGKKYGLSISCTDIEQSIGRPYHRVLEVPSHLFDFALSDLEQSLQGYTANFFDNIALNSIVFANDKYHLVPPHRYQFTYPNGHKEFTNILVITLSANNLVTFSPADFHTAVATDFVFAKNRFSYEDRMILRNFFSDKIIKMKVGGVDFREIYNKAGCDLDKLNLSNKSLADTGKPFSVSLKAIDKVLPPGFHYEKLNSFFEKQPDFDKNKSIKWSKAIEDGLSKNDIKAHPRIIAAILAIMQRESGFREDPPLQRDLLPLFDNIYDWVNGATTQYVSGTIDTLVLPKSCELQLIADEFKTEYRGRIARAKTESQADQLGKEMGELLEKTIEKCLLTVFSDKFSEAKARETSKHIAHRIRPTSLGAMQLQVRNAIEVSKSRGEKFKSEEDREETIRKRLMKIEYSLDYALAYYWPIWEYYLRTGISDPEKYIFADFNSGFGSSRNAALQSMLNNLSKKLKIGNEIAEDGDLLLYEESQASKKLSNTEKLIIELSYKGYLLDDDNNVIDKKTIREDLLLEKTIHFQNTVTYRAICRAYKLYIKKTPILAKVPDISINAEFKTGKKGQTFTVKGYSENCMSKCKKILDSLR